MLTLLCGFLQGPVKAPQSTDPFLGKSRLASSLSHSAPTGVAASLPSEQPELIKSIMFFSILLTSRTLTILGLPGDDRADCPSARLS